LAINFVIFVAKIKTFD